MKYSVIEFTREEKYIKEFLELPGRLYSKKELMQNKEEELAVLNETHPLSHYFHIHRLLVTDEGKRTVCRAILTVYENDRTAYLGFFESENSRGACSLLFHRAEELAKEEGCHTVVGPVDASFWIRYRFKVNRFKEPYTGEPYNKDYYAGLWQAAGYQCMERYYSNRYRVVEKGYRSEKFTDRLKEKEAKGYVIKSPDAKTFDDTLKEVYGLLITLYSGFPVFKHITEGEFCRQFSYLKKLIRYRMVKMAYYQKKPVGFFVSIPDYKNTVYGRLSVSDIVKYTLTRIKPKEYVMLYMGVDAGHRGLGKALAESIKEELQKQKTASVGALIRKGNINRDYFKELVAYEYEYVLLKKELLHEMYENSEKMQ